MSADLSQFYQVFFDESAEHLAGMEKLLLGLDVSNPSMDDLNAVFRAAHSIKGGAGTFGFNDMAEVTHDLETLLDRLRKQEMSLTAEMVNIFLEAGDVIAMQLSAHRGEGEVAAGAVSKVRDKLEQLASASGAGAKGGADAGGSFDSGSGNDSGDSDSGFFDDQPGAPAPAPVQAAPTTIAAAEANKVPSRVGAKIEIHGQGFGFFDDEPTTSPKQPPKFGSSAERGVEMAPRKEISSGKEITRTGPSPAHTATSGDADADFGLFDDQPGKPAPAQSAPKKPSPAPAEADDETANQKTKRDFHGKGYGFF